MVTLAVLGALAALALFAPVRNRAVSPTLGANLRTRSGTPLPLDAPVPLR